MLTRRSILRALPLMVALPRLWSEQKDLVPSDDELTKNLLSASGPTFRVEDKKLHKKWSLIAYGDMRFTDPANLNVTNPKVRRWLVSQIAKEHPDALLLSGDVPYDGSVENDFTRSTARKWNPGAGRSSAYIRRWATMSCTRTNCANRGTGGTRSPT